MFAEERPALGPLPLEPFRYYRYGERTVHLDGCVEVEAAYYGAPPGWIGQRLQVQWNDLHVRLLAPKTVQLLASMCAPRGWHPQRDRRVSVTELPTHVPGCGKRTGVCGFIPHCASAFRLRVSVAYGWFLRAPPCERVSIAGKSGGANRLCVACSKP